MLGEVSCYSKEAGEGIWERHSWRMNLLEIAERRIFQSRKGNSRIPLLEVSLACLKTNRMAMMAEAE